MLEFWKKVPLSGRMALPIALLLLSPKANYAAADSYSQRLLPVRLNHLGPTNITASSGALTLVANPPTGHYRTNFYVVMSANGGAGAAGNFQVQVVCSYPGVANTTTVTSGAVNFNVNPYSGSVIQGSYPMSCGNNANLTFQVNFNSNNTTPTVGYEVSVERLF